MKHIHKILKHKSSESIFLTLLFTLPLFTLLPLGVDLFLPALNDIQNYFTNSNNHIEKLSISLYLLFWGLGQLVWGKVADIIGRRKVALLGLFFFTLFSFLISTVNKEDADLFLTYRALQSFGGSACFTAIFAIIRDTFDGHKLTKAYSYLNGFLAIIPISAPLIGAFLLQNNDWQYLFLVFTFVGLASMVWTYVLTAETLVKTKKDRLLKKEKFFESYVNILKNDNFRIYLFLSIIGFLGIMFYITVSPLYLIGHLNISKIDFGYMFMSIAFIFMIGSFTVPNLVEKYGLKNILTFAVISYFVGGIVGISMSSYDTWYTYIIPMAISAMGCTIFVSACPAYALRDFKENAGQASGLFSALNFSISSLGATYLASTLNISSSKPYFAVFLALSIIVVIASFLYTRKK
ncbi:MAG: Bcr/CflA family efflux MFS transporter [Campylobacteraceae bacterium]|nr:Bcr/CflA family efflux MFS transporter [Campylobacteraceae bacterium]